MIALRAAYHLGIVIGDASALRADMPPLIVTFWESELNLPATAGAEVCNLLGGLLCLQLPCQPLQGR